LSPVPPSISFNKARTLGSFLQGKARISVKIEMRIFSASLFFVLPIANASVTFSI